MDIVLFLIPREVLQKPSVDEDTTDKIVEGTTRAWSVMGYELLHSNYSYEASLPESDKWRAHRTLPTADFFAAWTLRYQKLVWYLSPRTSSRSTGTFSSRAEQLFEEDELCQQPLTEWHPDLSSMKKIEDFDPEDLDNEVDEYSRLLRIKRKAVSWR